MTLFLHADAPVKVAKNWLGLLFAADYSLVSFAVATIDEVVLSQLVDFILRILQLGKHVLIGNLVHIKHVFFELTHEFHVVKGVDLQLRELIVEASLTDLGGLSDIRVH